jgi:hypothetical protein
MAKEAGKFRASPKPAAPLREPMLYLAPLAGASTSIYMRRICEDALAGEWPKHNLM